VQSRKTSRVKLFAGLCLSLLFCVSSNLPCFSADGTTLSPVNIPTASTPDANEARRIINSKGKLTLEIYLRAVDANFPGLKGALDQQRIASANRLERQGLFDPLISNESGYTKMQNTSKEGVAKYVTFNYPKIELPFRSGVRLFGQFRYNPLSSQSP
jgi:hypothetical protein